MEFFSSRFFCRSAAVASHVFLDSFQKVADAAISAKGRREDVYVWCLGVVDEIYVLIMCCGEVLRESWARRLLRCV